MVEERIASLADADVIVFVNNTQLDAGDQQSVSQSEAQAAYTKRRNTQSLSPLEAAPFLCSLLRSARAQELQCGCCCHHPPPSITNTHARARTRFAPDTSFLLYGLSVPSIPVRIYLSDENSLGH